MIVWSGKGILALVFPMIGLLAGFGISEFGYRELIMSVLVSLGGLLTWYLGKNWNKAVIYFDEASQQYYKTENGHTLFWIPMQYVGMLTMIFSATAVIGLNLPIGIILGLLLVYVAKYKYFKERGLAFSKSDKRDDTDYHNTHRSSLGGWESRQDR